MYVGLLVSPLAPRRLRFGSREYEFGIVIKTMPLTLISMDGEARWIEINQEMAFREIGEIHPKYIKSYLNRLITTASPIFIENEDDFAQNHINLEKHIQISTRSELIFSELPQAFVNQLHVSNKAVDIYLDSGLDIVYVKAAERQWAEALDKRYNKAWFEALEKKITEPA